MLARVKSDEKEELAADLRHVFMTGVGNYTIYDAWQRWQNLCYKWGRYTSIKRMGQDESYRYYMTLTYHKDIQSMIYTTNWIERLQRTFRRVLRFRTALPNEQSALTLMGKTAMDIRCYQRKIPNINLDRSLFVSGTPTYKQINKLICQIKENILILHIVTKITQTHFLKHYPEIKSILKIGYFF